MLSEVLKGACAKIPTTSTTLQSCSSLNIVQYCTIQCFSRASLSTSGGTYSNRSRFLVPPPSAYIHCLFVKGFPNVMNQSLTSHFAPGVCLREGGGGHRQNTCQAGNSLGTHLPTKVNQYPPLPSVGGDLVQEPRRSFSFDYSCKRLKIQCNCKFSGYCNIF